eukprot:11058705-Lingulodinium_polyedra.AAC.1
MDPASLDVEDLGLGCVADVLHAAKAEQDAVDGQLALRSLQCVQARGMARDEPHPAHRRMCRCEGRKGAEVLALEGLLDVRLKDQ